MFFVQNKTKSLISIPLSGETIQLKPGTNTVQDDKWKSAKELYMIRVQLECDLLDDSAHVDDKPNAHPLAGLGKKELRTQIKNNFDEAQLVAWLASAPKDAVSLIEAQLKTFKKAQ